MKIYMASSWRSQDRVLTIAGCLRIQGYAVDAFCDSSSRFTFVAAKLPGVDKLDHITARDEPAFNKAFEEDRRWLDWADLCILVLPAGNSAHLEAGYTVGKGKPLIIVSNIKAGEWDVMYGFANRVCRWGDLPALLMALEELAEEYGIK